MAVIKGATSAVGLEVDSGGALRNVQYGADGQPVVKSLLARAQAMVAVSQSTTTAANSYVWALRNGSSRIVELRRVRLESYFTGTGAATLSIYELVKLTSHTAFGNGTVVAPILERTSLGAASAEARVLDTGLTLTGAVVQSVGARIVNGRVPPSATVPLYKGVLELQWGSQHDTPIELAQNETLAIRLVNTAVVADQLQGYVEWDER